MRLIVGLTGLSGSGKSTIAFDLVNRHGFTRISFGDIVRREARSRNDGLPLQDLGELLIHQWGWERFCREVIGPHYSEERLVIDGIRHVGAIGALRVLLSPSRLCLVFVDITEPERLHRLEARKADGKREAPIAMHSVEREVEQLRTMADLVVQAKQHGTSDYVLKICHQVAVTRSPPA